MTPMTSSPPIAREFVLGPVADCRLVTFRLDSPAAEPPRAVVYITLRGEAEVTPDALDAWASWLTERAAELRASDVGTTRAQPRAPAAAAGPG